MLKSWIIPDFNTEVLNLNTEFLCTAFQERTYKHMICTAA